MLDQRRRRWADVAKMLYKCFVFAGKPFLKGRIERLLQYIFSKKFESLSALKLPVWPQLL